MLNTVTKLDFIIFLLFAGVAGLLGASVADICLGWGIGTCIACLLNDLCNK